MQKKNPLKKQLFIKSKYELTMNMVFLTFRHKITLYGRNDFKNQSFKNDIVIIKRGSSIYM